MSCKNCKKVIAIGAVSIVLVSSGPLCKECLAIQAPDLPSGNELSNKTYKIVYDIASDSSTISAGTIFKEVK